MNGEGGTTAPGVVISTGVAQERRPFVGSVRPLQEGDLGSVRGILESWIRDSETGEVLGEEVDQYIDEMKTSLLGETGRSFFVAEEAGRTIGVVGLRTPPQEALAPFIRTEKPVELIRLYVDKDERQGRGVGKALVRRLIAEAESRGATEVILESGPRNKDTAWDFYDKLFDGRKGVIKDKYGPGNDAPVWTEQIAAWYP